ncbi:MAG: ATP-binding protein [Ignavibacteriales bacterium]|nr:ATP-binding protein [Ignavibacteriales bacterium]
MKTDRLVPSKLKPASRHAALPPEKLRWRCNPKSIKVKTSAEIKPSREIIGQERALRALRVGLAMSHFGYNIFVTGLSGTGRTTTIKRLLHVFESKRGELRDHCYVFNFKHPDLPIAISLPAGQGRGLKEDMASFIRDLIRDLPTLYESQRFQQARKAVLAHFQERQKSVLVDFEKKVKERGFELVQVQVGNLMRPDIAPLVGEKATNLDEIDGMVQKGEFSKEQYDSLKAAQALLEKQMAVVFRELRNIEKKAQQSVTEVEERFVMPMVDEYVEIIKTTYESGRVRSYLEEVRTNIKENLSRFQKNQSTSSPPTNGAQEEDEDEDDFLEYQVNLLVDNSDTEHIPIVIETNPKFKNIFGTVERVMERGGVWKTDFTQIKPGALLQADGGYLVLNALDVLLEPGVWQDLKRSLRTGKAELQPNEPMYGFAPTGMKPEAIDLNIKVIMIGDSEIYQLLYLRDDDFKKIFKIRADFDYEMERDNSAVNQYLGFVKMVTEDEKLRHFDRDALASLVEFGVRLSGSQKKLSTRFNVLADVIREANYWAEQDVSPIVKSKHVLKAIEERIYRVKLIEDKVQEMITDGVIMIDTQGAVIGQVNGLSVYDTGEHAFGKPARITAKTSLGRAGVINIERESDMSGPTHNKGFAILSGYLRSKFAQDKPLIMSASVTFEQSYSGVDGDSASSTEIYAILSSLAEVPLRQDIAVTGSVNQNGEVQPIGGVNLKIEGFFDVCKDRGLTGEQGVMVPKANVRDLMLREDVLEAVRKDLFHIYAVSSIDEGVEILTGWKAGHKRSNGSFESGTIYHLVDSKLRFYAEQWRKFEAGHEQEK